MAPKSPLSTLLSRNAFESHVTLGFFCREKMGVIHAVTPEFPLREALEVRGEQNGLTSLLYPTACVSNREKPGEAR